METEQKSPNYLKENNKISFHSGLLLASLGQAQNCVVSLRGRFSKRFLPSRAVFCRPKSRTQEQEWQMGKMKTLLASAAIGAGMLATAGNAQAVEWIMASGYPDSNFLTKNLKMFVEDVKAGTSVDIQLNSNDSLIKLDAIKTSVQRGQIPIGEIRLGVYGNEDPMYVLAGLPFIAPDYAAAWLLKDLQKEYFDAIFKKAGMRVLFYQPWPGQGFYTKFPVTKVDDFKGKKLRI